MSYDQLILVCLYRLFQRKEEAEFENLLEECFQQFPKKFVFSNHSWPDARKLDRPLRHLQESGFVFQDDSRFFLTKKGKTQGEKIIKKLYQEKLF
jgi:hypothetical protein